MLTFFNVLNQYLFKQNFKFFNNLLLYKREALKIIRDGFLIDFWIKKIVENLIRKLCIYSGIFFGEKYLMENLGPKLVENIIWTFKNLTFFEHLSLITLFYQVIFSFFVFNLYLNFYLILFYII